MLLAVCMRHMWRMQVRSYNCHAPILAHEIGREVKKLAEKHRYNLIMSMDDPIQRKAWEILCAAKSGTRNKMVCNAIVRQDFADFLREMIRDELSKVSFVQQNSEPEVPQKEDDTVLDFLFALQNSAEP